VVSGTDRVIEDLSVPECEALLESRHFGRVGLESGGRQVILPVNYVFADGRVAIRTDPGSELARGSQQPIAFEIDEIDEPGRTGWSVLVTGVGYDVSDALDAASADLRRLPIDTWAPGEKSRWIRIEKQTITGRRVRAA
jgi:prepilin-type processing-associated H-X9-DG protein